MIDDEFEGEVTNLKIDRGYGFILLDDGRSVFFHVRNLGNSLEFDEQLLHRRIICRVGEGDKGLFAYDVRAVKTLVQ